MWEPDEKVFKVEVHDLALETDDIYFLTGLSRIRERLSLTIFRGGGENTENYISKHCVVGTRKSSGKITLKNVRDISLRTVLFTITRIFGSAAPHLTTKYQMK